MLLSLMVYQYRLEQFEGPLDLLLSLIEREKLDITQVSLAQVADQYLEYIRREEAISLDNLAQFLGIAARLILIKSRALLPLLAFSEEEEEAMDDLELHLRYYQRFRQASEALGLLFRSARPAYGRESFLGREKVFYPPEGLTAADLRTHFVSVLGEIPLYEELPEKELQKVISIEEKILSLQRTLAERAEATFSELVEGTRTRVEVIVSFLAVLELVKQRFVQTEQDGYFGTIRITRLA